MFFDPAVGDLSKRCVPAEPGPVPDISLFAHRLLARLRLLPVAMVPHGGLMHSLIKI